MLSLTLHSKREQDKATPHELPWFDASDSVHVCVHGKENMASMFGCLVFAALQLPDLAIKLVQRFVDCCYGELAQNVSLPLCHY